MRKFDNLADCLKIQKALASIDIEADLNECKAMWSTYSGTMQAHWLIVPNKKQFIIDALSTCFNLKSISYFDLSVLTIKK